MLTYRPTLVGNVYCTLATKTQHETQYRKEQIGPLCNCITFQCQSAYVRACGVICGRPLLLQSRSLWGILVGLMFSIYGTREESLSSMHQSCLSKGRHEDVTLVFMRTCRGEVWMKQYLKQVIPPNHKPCNYCWCSLCVFETAIVEQGEGEGREWMCFNGGS